jgi:arginase
LERTAKNLGYTVKDLGDIDAAGAGEETDDLSNAKNSRWVGDTNRQTADLIVEELKGGKSDNFLLSIGGDHSIAIGTISGLLDTYASPKQNDTDLCVIWVDAHADINTPGGSVSGNIHGMPVAFLMREESLYNTWAIPGFEWMDPSSTTRNRRLNPRKLVYIGLRDVDEAEEEILRRFNIKNYRMPEVHSKGINKVMEEIIEYLNLGSDSTSTDRLHLSFDIDGLDPNACPATGTAVENGLTVAEGLAICEACGKTGRLVAMDLVEVNPALSDEAGALQTVQAGLSLLQTALASRPQVLRRRLDA